MENEFWFAITGTSILTITYNKVKSSPSSRLGLKLDGLSKAVDKSGLHVKLKAHINQHGILPKILWPLVYAVPRFFVSHLSGFDLFPISFLLLHFCLSLLFFGLPS